MSPAPVPKPGNAGSGQAAVIDTRSTFVNVRSGPGTTYDDIGDIRDKSLVKYYPATQRNGWVWVEQFTLGGWVATSVATFNHVDVEPPKDFPPTPYDGGSAIWHWKGQAVQETTIAEFAANIRRLAPNVRHIFVKVGDGSSWQGNFDSGDMAVDGPDDVARWVRILAEHDLEFHAWSVLKGRDIDGEADIIIRTANVPGVKSFILDVEPFEHYWQVGPEPIAPLMTKARAGVPPGYHIGMAVDPRRVHYKSIYPDEWFPFIDSIHTMSYWRTFRRTVEDTLEETYAVWGGYGKPLIPILQGSSSTIEEQKEAISLATTRFGAKALSWWRYGVIPQWEAINIPLSVDDQPDNKPGDDGPPPDTVFGHEVLIFAGKEGFRSGTYTGQEEFQTYQGTFGWDYLYTSTEPTTSKVWAEWRTTLPEDGVYQISVFVPARFSTTKKARYKIHGIRGTSTEVIVDINQSIHRNEWVPLGVFDLVKNQQNAGKVFLNDVTGEVGREISFDALRYRQIIRLEPKPSPPSDVPVADGFDAPVGTAEERAGGINTSTNYWFGEWRDATGFGRDTVPGYISSQGAYHTGVDLNWKFGNSDLGQSVYAPASGVVIFQANLKFWGNVTVIRHDPLFTPTGPVYYTRYGHMQNVTVKVGDRVERGQKIGEIGTGGGRFIAHLHYDVVRTAILETKPSDWPRMDINRLLGDYVDPLTFTVNNRPRNR
ncbi:MAG: peptidoglycan DD-metalloendopeptidase family protein [Chloroflexota bacterium]